MKGYLQVLPFQCSTRVFDSLAASMSLPAAQALRGDKMATPVRSSLPVLGLDTDFQTLPVQRSITEVLSPCPTVPTAQAPRVEAATPNRMLSAAPRPGTRFHLLPFQRRIKVVPPSRVLA